MNRPMTSAPLAGLKVLELARILAGPWAGQLLADLGADVVKVESPEGDDTRGWGPPFVTGENGESRSAAYFHACNRGKRSIIADFRKADDLVMVKALAGKADVVIENFKAAGSQSSALMRKHARGQSPAGLLLDHRFWADRALCRARGLRLSHPGHGRADVDHWPARRPADQDRLRDGRYLHGMYATTGILAALRRRDQTGEGATLDLALMDSQVAVLGNQAMNYLVSGKAPAGSATAIPTSCPMRFSRSRTGISSSPRAMTGNIRSFAASSAG